MPRDCVMTTVDERVVRAPIGRIFDYAANVEQWPSILPHYRFVRFLDRTNDGGGIVDMSAYRPFGIVHWPTWWRSRMGVTRPGGTATPSIRFTHIGGVTTGMDVEWSFAPVDGGTRVRIVHVWNGPPIPLIGVFAATAVIGPLFVHGIASRTLAGLGAAAERGG